MVSDDVKRGIPKFDASLKLEQLMKKILKQYSNRYLNVLSVLDMNVSCGSIASSISGLLHAIFPHYMGRNPDSMYLRVPPIMAEHQF